MVQAGAVGFDLRGFDLRGFDLCGARTGHQAPCLAIFFVERFASAVGIEAKVLA